MAIPNFSEHSTSHAWRALVLVTSLVLAVAAPRQLIADDDDHERAEQEEHLLRRHGYRSQGQSYRQLAPLPENAAYKTECASCHLQYHPGLLPARSWEKLMKNLTSHFGEDASLEEKTRAEIATFLVSHAADRAPESRRSRKIAQSIPADETPLRITTTRFFRHKHDEVRAEVWSRPTVKGRFNCLACHQEAEKGYFDEDTVKIPKDPPKLPAAAVPERSPKR